jgi:hypothetical protein
MDANKRDKITTIVGSTAAVVAIGAVVANTAPVIAATGAIVGAGVAGLALYRKLTIPKESIEVSRRSDSRERDVQ